MQVFDLINYPYYYYGLLNEREKESYQKMLRAILKLEPSVNLSYSINKDELARVTEFICHDRPDIFWYYGHYSYTYSGDLVYEVFFVYRMNKTEVESSKRKIASSMFLKNLDRLIESKKTPFEKALVTYEYIIASADYDNLATGDDWIACNQAYNIDGIILDGKGVCTGYAKVFQFFMSRHGVFCTYVTGKYANGGRHAWNLINLDDSYYYIDVTCGEPITSNWCINPVGYICYDNFCVTTQEFFKTHNIVLENKMPYCDDTRYNYYRYFNMIADFYSVSDVALRMAEAYKKGKCNAVIVYSDENTYLTAKRELFDKAKIFDAYSIIEQSIPSFDSKKVTYMVHDDNYKILLFF